jgi:circadian clock protein KaiC
MIDEKGLSVLPISSLSLAYPVTKQRVPTGIAELDTMFGGKGFYRGSSIMISGTAGTGKSSIAAAFADSFCARGEKCLYFSFEESPEQIIRNMNSIGFDLRKWVRNGKLKFHAIRPTIYGLETHLVSIHRLVEEFKPAAAVMDPVTNLAAIGDSSAIKSVMTRVIDYLKNKQITTVFTSLTEGGSPAEQSGAGISSLMDTWILLQNLEVEGARDRIISILKSRGMAHSSRVRQFFLTNEGIKLLEPEKVVKGKSNAR